MIDKSYVDETFEISCDVSGCSASAAYDTTDWHKMLAMAKADGWLFQAPEQYLADGVWLHSCGGHK